MTVARFGASCEATKGGLLVAGGAGPLKSDNHFDDDKIVIFNSAEQYNPDGDW